MKTNPMTEQLFEYVSKHSPAPHPILEKVVEATLERSDRMMQISQDQGAFMHLLTKMLGVKKAIEVGCFTGYSAISVASALPEGGLLYSFDIDPETSDLAQSFFREAELDEKIKVKIGPALTGLNQLLVDFGPESFDFAFLDADKENYSQYYERCLELLRPGGVILADNVLWGGSIIDQSNQDSSTLALRKFNDLVLNDNRVTSSMLHIADGIYMIVKN